MNYKVNETMKETRLVPSANNQKPRMNKELWAKYNHSYELWLSRSEEGAPFSQDLLDEVNRFRSDYDWMSYTFEGEDGKMGMKNMLGEIIVPANYDGFRCTFHYDYKIPALPALKNGKYGLVKTDGTGTELTDFVYDDMESVEWSFSFYFKKDGSKQFGIILSDGTEILPCCLDSYSKRISNVIVVRGNGKEGVYLPSYGIIIAPQYDSVDIPDSLEEPLCFTLDGVTGYVDSDGKFISVTEYDQLEASDEPTDAAQFEELNAKLICAQQDE